MEIKNLNKNGKEIELEKVELPDEINERVSKIIKEDAIERDDFR